MKGDELFLIMGKIDDTYIDEAKQKKHKRIKIQMLFIIAAVVCSLGSAIALVTADALATVNARYRAPVIISYSKFEDVFNSYEEFLTVCNSLDFTPDIPEELSGGAKFINGFLINKQDLVNEGYVTVDVVSATYQVDNKTISLSCELSVQAKLDSLYETADVFTINGNDVLYMEQKTLIRPANMSMVDQLKLWLFKIKSDVVLMLSENITEPILYYHRQLVWLNGGVRYDLISISENQDKIMDLENMLDIVRELK